jgi:hypothetical protein
LWDSIWWLLCITRTIVSLRKDETGGFKDSLRHVPRMPQSVAGCPFSWKWHSKPRTTTTETRTKTHRFSLRSRPKGVVKLVDDLYRRHECTPWPCTHSSSASGFCSASLVCQNLSDCTVDVLAQDTAYVSSAARRSLRWVPWSSSPILAKKTGAALHNEPFLVAVLDVQNV